MAAVVTAIVLTCILTAFWAPTSVGADTIGTAPPSTTTSTTATTQRAPSTSSSTTTAPPTSTTTSSPTTSGPSSNPELRPTSAGWTPAPIVDSRQVEANVVGTTSHVFVQGTDHALWWRELTNAGWSAWQSFGGFITSVPSAVAAPDGSFYVFVRGGDYALYWQRFDGAQWSGWQRGEGYLSSDPVAVATGTEVAVFVRGGDYALYWGMFRAGGAWAGWNNAGGYLTSKPAVAWINGGITAVVRGASGDAYYQQFGDGNGTPSGWAGLGGYLSSDPVLAADQTSGALAVRGGDNALYFRVLTTQWGPWQDGGGLLLSGPAGTVDASGPVFFVRGGDSSVYYQRVSAGGGQGYQSLGGGVSDIPAVSTDSSGTSVFVRGGGDVVYVQRYVNRWSGWTSLAGISTIGAPAAASGPYISVGPPPPPTGLGFDTCETPSTSVMSTWRLFSPYTSVGIYIGGINRACSNTALNNATWVNTVVGQGWRLIPIYVGLQAPCINFVSSTLSTDPTTAATQGGDAAADAAQRVTAAGLPYAPIYYDMEAYNNSNSVCVTAVRAFVDTWVKVLHYLGHPAGFYSSLCSGIVDQAAVASSQNPGTPDAIWIAAWNGRPNIFGFTGSCALSDGLWSFHQRLHQYTGGHYENYGGVAINIDSDAVDGPVAP